MKRIAVTLGLLLAGFAGADEGWHHGWEHREGREEHREVEFQRREVDRERARIEDERMRIEMERERLRREDEMRNRWAWHHEWHHPVVYERCEHPVVIEHREPTIVVAEHEPVRKPSARIEVEFPLGH